MHYEQLELELGLDDGCCGRTYPEQCQAEHRKEQTSKPSSPNASELKKKTPLLCLSLQRGGLWQELYWEENGASLGELSTYNITDAPNEGDASLFSATSMEWTHRKSCLSNIVQSNVDDRFYLSEKACKGIFNRAENRNKQLPEILVKALTMQLQNRIGNHEIGSVKETFGFDQGATRDIGDLFLRETSKTIANGTCPGHHNAVVICKECADSTSKVIPLDYHPNDSRIKVKQEDLCQSLTSRMGTGVGNVPLILETSASVIGADMYNQSITNDVSKTLNSIATDTDHVPVVIEDHSQALCNKKETYSVRRLTPEECELLQGFPVGYTNIGDWTDSKGRVRKCSESNRYKALGNSIGIPAWMHIIKGISAQYDRPATMGSLFDGIGGFPRIWEHYNGKGTARWASEIDEFCVAVTKHHFPEE